MWFSRQFKEKLSFYIPVWNDHCVGTAKAVGKQTGPNLSKPEASKSNWIDIMNHWRSCTDQVVLFGDNKIWGSNLGVLWVLETAVKQGSDLRVRHQSQCCIFRNETFWLDAFKNAEFWLLAPSRVRSLLLRIMSDPRLSDDCLCDPIIFKVVQEICTVGADVRGVHRRFAANFILLITKYYI